MTTFLTLCHILSIVLLIVGVVCCAIGVIGIFKMPDLLSKQHASGLIDTLGGLSICLSLALYNPSTLTALKVVVLGILGIVLSAPTSNALIQSALTHNIIQRSKKESQEGLNSD